jgi:hypothetical protein
VTTETGVIAMIAVITGIFMSCPNRAARTVVKGGVTPVTAVIAGRLRRDLRVGHDRRDSSRSSRSHGGHRPRSPYRCEAHVFAVIISTLTFFSLRPVVAAALNQNV